MRLKHCHHFHDFRELARRRLPGPIFNYVDGGADDEVTLRQNTLAFERCDLLPSVLSGVSEVDICKSLGISFPTWKRLKEEDNEALEALEEARREEESQLVGVLFEGAMDKKNT
jgi:hypothetical protein